MRGRDRERDHHFPSCGHSLRRITEWSAVLGIVLVIIKFSYRIAELKVALEEHKNENDGPGFTEIDSEEENRDTGLLRFAQYTIILIALESFKCISSISLYIYIFAAAWRKCVSSCRTWVIISLIVNTVWIGYHVTTVREDGYVFKNFWDLVFIMLHSLLLGTVWTLVTELDFGRKGTFLNRQGRSLYRLVVHAVQMMGN